MKTINCLFLGHKYKMMNETGTLFDMFCDKCGDFQSRNKPVRSYVVWGAMDRYLTRSIGSEVINDLMGKK